MKIIKTFAESYEDVVELVKATPECAVVMTRRPHAQLLLSDPQFSDSVIPNHYRLIIGQITSERFIEVVLHIQKISPGHTELHILGDQAFLNTYPDSTHKH